MGNYKILILFNTVGLLMHRSKGFLAPSTGRFPYSPDKHELISRMDMLVNERSEWIRKVAISVGLSLGVGTSNRESVLAAPPMAVIGEELGYFPVTNRDGETIYIPARVKRKSSEQAILLSEFLRESGAVMYGAFWCPHCQRQREMFGREAWQNVVYVECAKSGVSSNIRLCNQDQINGFPTWKLYPNRRKTPNFVSGEMPLDQLAKLSGYNGPFDANLEVPLPSNMDLGSCR